MRKFIHFKSNYTFSQIKECTIKCKAGKTSLFKQLPRKFTTYTTYNTLILIYIITHILHILHLYNTYITQPILRYLYYPY